MSEAPNILFIVVDELTADILPTYGHKVVKAPNLTRLAERSVVFDAAYANSPICCPSRASMMSGRLAPAIEAWDNATPLGCDVPCIPHFLGNLGYDTTLVGKMHFIGPDQLHGYENRLTTDIYPSDFSWTANAKTPRTAPNIAGVSMRPILDAGPCKRNLQIDYDEEVQLLAEQYIWDKARDRKDKRPFFLTVSYTHPHPPFDAPQPYWDMYEDAEIDLPRVGPIDPDRMDPLSLQLYYNHRRHEMPVAEENVIAARRAYYAMVTWIDERIGRLLDTLEDAGFGDDTVIVFTSDHGEMLGERGMWFKMCMFEYAERVPLFVSWPERFAPRRIRQNVSLVDLLPTFIDFARGKHEEPLPCEETLDGRSLLRFLQSGADANWPDLVISDFNAGGSPAPVRMVKEGTWKLIRIGTLANLLFNIEEDPEELCDRSADKDAEDILARLLSLSEHGGYDPEVIAQRVLLSQERRRLIHTATKARRAPVSWNWKVRPDDDVRFVRGGGPVYGEDPTKARARLPLASYIPEESEITAL